VKLYLCIAVPKTHNKGILLIRILPGRETLLAPDEHVKYRITLAREYR